MKRNILILLMALIAASSFASDIECIGRAVMRVHDDDTTFIFRDEIGLRSTVGNINWYYADGSLYASNTDEIYPDEGTYKAYGHIFRVQLYQDIPDLDFTVQTTCDNTILHVSGDVSSSAHTYTLYYNALAWNTEEWVDSAVIATGDLTASISMPPLYGPTPIRLCYDAGLRDSLGLDSACVEYLLPLDSIKAVKMELTSLATPRGNDTEKSNEKHRPTSQTLIKGSEYSGPLEVAFYSNPTPGASFYRWSIYKSTDMIVSRTDQDIRYTFSEPGVYRVVCSVNNEFCQTDSMETNVQISESYLAVPNVFTPNGDGINDEFRVAYCSLREFHCWVYNRWGKLVYEWTDPAKGWDGTINGVKAAEGAYFYVIRALGTDAAKDASYVGLKSVYTKRKLNADESVMGVYQMSGDINLLR